MPLLVDAHENMRKIVFGSNIAAFGTHTQPTHAHQSPACLQNLTYFHDTVDPANVPESPNCMKYFTPYAEYTNVLPS